MLNAQTISAEVQKTVDNILDDIQRLGISKEPNRMLAAYLYSQREESDLNVINSVREYADLFKKTVFPSKYEMAAMKAEYKQVIQHCLSKPVMDKYNPDHLSILPNGAVELCKKLACIKEGSSVLIKSTEQPNLITGLSDLSCNVQIFSNQWAFMQILSDALDDSTRMVVDNRISPMEEIDSQCKYDYIFSFPPIFDRKKEEDLLHIICEQIELSLSEKGELYCFLPEIVADSLAHQSFRKRLVETGYALTIIQLPRISPSVTAIRMVLLKVSKNQQHNIMLVDTEYDNFSKKETQTRVERILCAIESKDERFVWVGNKDALRKDLSLRPSKYLAKNMVQPQKGEKVISLKEIITLCTHDRKKVSTSKEYKCVSMKCLSSSYLNCNLDFDSLATEKTNHVHMLFNEDCIIFNTFMNNPRVGRITNSFGREYAIRKEMFPFKMNKSALKFITEDFLIKSLMSESTKLQISALSNPGVIAMVNPEDFLSIRIAIPSLKEQEALVKEDIRKTMSDSEKKLDDMFVSYKKEISSRKHRIGQGFGAFSANWDILSTMMNIHGGHLDKKDVIDPDTNLTIGDIFEAMERQISLIGYQIDHLSDMEFDFGKEEGVEPGIFIHHFTETHKDTRFVFEEQYDPKSYEDFPVEYRVKLKFAPKAMETVFENIVTNAIAHGFTDPNRKDYKIKFEESFVDADQYEIRISNNGNPLPSDINPEDIFLYGFSTASQEENHSGIGCADCRSILEKYNATISVASTPTEDFTVTFCITFHQNMLDGE